MRLTPLPPAAHAVGASRFVRYAYPPNARGYCGPADAEELFDYATTGVVDGGLRERAREFEGAWPYLELIAEACGVEDPLDPRIVRAYWLGEPPVQAVRLSRLADHVDRRFRHRAGTGRAGWAHLADALRPGAVPDHAFHVMAVYPWVGLMREGVTEPARAVVEACCVRPGRVIEVTGDTAAVSVPAFVWDGDGLGFGAAERRDVRWRRDGAGLVGDLRPSDIVAVHWDWVCERLDAAAAQRLTRRLGQRLAAARVA